ncbi:MAG: alpha-galactosidase [Lachnospiraceae bacterium]|nr:alpha-galactosidase [Lachnospiraceae bacterium]
MGIIVDDSLFTLHTKSSTYQMKVDDKGILLHTYYGKRTDETDYSYLISFADRGFSGNIAAAREDRTYSLDYLPQEFPVCGSGDYRINCLNADLGAGVNDCLLFYDSYKTYKGKYSLTGLPAMFAEEGDSVETLEILLKDYKDDLYVRLLYGVFEDYDMITRAVIIENGTDQDVKLSRVMSTCIDFSETDLDLIHFYGKHAGERQMERLPLFHGIAEQRSTRGTSSHQHNPFVIAAKRDTNEEKGECYGFSLLYSGGFHMQAETDQINQVRLVMGIDDSDFLWTLCPGESFVAPEVCMTYSDGGIGKLSQAVHRGFFKHLIRSPWKDKRRPVLVNNWEATYFNFNAEILLDIAREAAKMDLDMLVLDDGWFGKRDDDYSGLGDWFVNEKKLGCSLKELVDKISDMGLFFGIWFEPEMISEDSDLYRAHPEWAMLVPGREPIRGRNQLVLDMSREDVVAYVKERLFAVMDSADIRYIKWDMNRSLALAYSALFPRERQGELRHRYVLGFYEVMEALLTRYPDLLLEGCSGGGGRYDAGMLYYVPQIWCSDNSDAIERLRIHYGTSFGYPMSTVAAHVSVSPNEQNGRVTPLKTRGICAMQGAFGYELNLCEMSEEEKEQVKEQVKTFKEHYKLFQFGDYYRIASPFDNRDFTAWEYVDREGKEACMSVVYTDLHANPAVHIVKFKGLCKEKNYEVSRDGEPLGEFSGAALMNGGFVLPVPKENYDSCQFYACAK